MKRKNMGLDGVREISGGIAVSLVIFIVGNNYKSLENACE